MSLRLSSDQLTIRDEAQRFLGERATSAALRASIESGAAYDDALWRSISQELGWCGVAIEERRGGLGLGFTELCLILEQTGARLAGAPYLSTAAFAAPLIAATATDEAASQLLPRIAAGALRAAVSYPDLSSGDAFHGDAMIKATREGDRFRLDGAVAHVVDIAAADLILVPARLDDGAIALFAIALREGARIDRHDALDLTRSIGRLSFDQFSAAATARIDDPARWSVGSARALDAALLGLAAEELGAAQSCFDLTLRYIGERVQFGRTIASFQAIKHRCAKLAVDIETARSLVMGAASGFDSCEPSAALDIAAARAATQELAIEIASEAIQMHGGVGCAWEYDPHLYFRRAQATSAWFGGAGAQLDRIARHALAA